ncbi:MAG: transposase, partial [Gemmataceae bacterium]|nr:transposase [Gemmataceae bacterium]
LIGGEELHNNHHAFASSARFSTQPWEFDIGWWYIRVLCALGLARVKKIAPRLYRDPRKSLIDEDTVRAVTSCRLQVLWDYTRLAFRRVYREQCESEGPANRPRRFLTRSQSPMDTAVQQRLAQGLRDSAILAKVHHFQTRLQTIVQETPVSLEQQRRLQEWHQQAKTSGIAALEQFSEILRSYSLQPGTARRPLTS